MTHKQLAKAIRDKQSEYSRVSAQFRQELEAVVQQCKHELVVIVCTEYPGSYSWDYDDGHDECRQCLVCGRVESAGKNKFKTLLKPFKRLELGYPYSKNSPYKESPLHNCLSTPIKDLLRWVEQNGYKV